MVRAQILIAAILIEVAIMIAWARALKPRGWIEWTLFIASPIAGTVLVLARRSNLCQAGRQLSPQSLRDVEPRP
jgi:hypothetical protein